LLSYCQHLLVGHYLTQPTNTGPSALSPDNFSTKVRPSIIANFS